MVSGWDFRRARHTRVHPPAQEGHFLSHNQRRYDRHRSDRYCRRPNPSGNPLSLAISADERELAVGTAEGEVHIWSLTDGRPLATAKPNIGPIQTLRFAGQDLLVNGNTEPLQVARP
jgi:hypothetical protein